MLALGSSASLVQTIDSCMTYDSIEKLHELAEHAWLQSLGSSVGLKADFFGLTSWILIRWFSQFKVHWPGVHTWAVLILHSGVSISGTTSVGKKVFHSQKRITLREAVKIIRPYCLLNYCCTWSKSSPIDLYLLRLRCIPYFSRWPFGTLVLRKNVLQECQTKPWVTSCRPSRQCWGMFLILSHAYNLPNSV